MSILSQIACLRNSTISKRKHSNSKRARRRKTPKMSCWIELWPSKTQVLSFLRMIRSPSLPYPAILVLTRPNWMRLRTKILKFMLGKNPTSSTRRSGVICLRLYFPSRRMVIYLRTRKSLMTRMRKQLRNSPATGDRLSPNLRASTTENLVIASRLNTIKSFYKSCKKSSNSTLIGLQFLTF